MKKNSQLLKEKLAAMMKADQYTIMQAQSTGKVAGKVFAKQAEELEEIISEYGWPTISLVGKEGVRAAWLVAQHADHNVPFQKRCLQLLRELRNSYPNEVMKEHIAFLQDRVLLNENKPQVFGTQFVAGKDGRLRPWKIKDEESLDALRKEYHLPSFKEYLTAAQERNRSLGKKKERPQ